LNQLKKEQSPDEIFCFQPKILKTTSSKTARKNHLAGIPVTNTEQCDVGSGRCGQDVGTPVKRPKLSGESSFLFRL